MPQSIVTPSKGSMGPREPLFESIAVALETQGYFVAPNALPPSVGEDLLECLARRRADAFRKARIGRGCTRDTNEFVRRDAISWMDERQGEAPLWFEFIAEMRRYLNRRLFLGLFSFESHFAIYGIGDFYKRHRDAFRGQSNRVVSLVTYLNRGWEPDQGGELVIYSRDETATHETILRVLPEFATLVLFLSEAFPHEVLAANRERFSVAGWFRINTSHADRIDPPS